MLEAVRQRLLDHPVGRQFGSRQGPFEMDGVHQPDRQPGRGLHPSDQRSDVAQARRGVRHPLAVVVADLVQDPADVGQRGTSGGGDRAQRLPGPCQVAVQQLLGGTGLHDHHADRVPEDVVQLPGDPQPLLRRRPGRPLAFEFGLLAGGLDLALRLGLPHYEQLATLADARADHPAAQVERHLGDRALHAHVDRTQHRGDGDAAQQYRDGDARLPPCPPGDRRVEGCHHAQRCGADRVVADDQQQGAGHAGEEHGQRPDPPDRQRRDRGHGEQHAERVRGPVGRDGVQAGHVNPHRHGGDHGGEGAVRRDLARSDRRAIRGNDHDVSLGRDRSRFLGLQTDIRRRDGPVDRRGLPVGSGTVKA